MPVPSTSSRLKAIQDTILADLRARAAQPGSPLANVQLHVGHPGEALQKEAVWISQLRIQNAEPVAIGRQTLDQYIAVEVITRIVFSGTDDQALTQRAFDVSNEVEETLRLDPNLNDQVFYGQITGGQFDLFTDTDGRACAVTVESLWRSRKG